MKDMKCPRCGSHEQVPAPKEEWRQPATFTATRPYKCKACEAVWEPETASWALWLGMLAGTIVFMLGPILFVGDNPQPRQAVCALALGSATITGCFRRLRQKAWR